MMLMAQKLEQGVYESAEQLSYVSPCPALGFKDGILVACAEHQN